MAMTNNSIPVCESNELDSSKPIVPILDSSSQLMDDTLVSESRLVIDVTPLKSKKRKKPKEKENIVSVSISLNCSSGYFSMNMSRKLNQGGGVYVTAIKITSILYCNLLRVQYLCHPTT